MASDEYIVTINPDPMQQSSLVEMAKYDLVHDTILASLYEYGPMTPAHLIEMVEDQLGAKFDEALYKAVKLDMEVRGELHRALRSRPRLVGFSGLPCAI